MIHMRRNCKLCSRRLRRYSEYVVMGRVVILCFGCVVDLKQVLAVREGVPVSSDRGTKMVGSDGVFFTVGCD